MLRLHKKMGHIGGETIYQLAKETFYWPGMEKGIKDFFKNKRSHGKLKSSSPMDKVRIDFLKVDKCFGG